MVLVAVMGATVVGAIVSLSAAQTYAEAVRRDVRDARSAAQTALAEVDAVIEQNPYLPFERVLGVERTRVCERDGTETLVLPGNAWDVALCGTTWTYASPATTPADGSARVELHHIPALGAWDVRVLARGGTLDAGYERVMARDTAAGVSALSQDTLSLADLYRDAEDTAVDGLTVYTGGSLDLSTAAGDGLPGENPPSAGTPWIVTGSVFAHEGTAGPAGSPVPDGSGYDIGPAGADIPIREFATSPWTLQAAQSQMAASRQIACPNRGADPALTEPAPVPAAYVPTRRDGTPTLTGPAARHTCLDRGSSVLVWLGDGDPAATVDVDEDGTNDSTYQQIAPTNPGPGSTRLEQDNAQALAVIPTRVDANSNGTTTDPEDFDALTVRWSYMPVDGTDCTSACDLNRIFALSAADGRHPGTYDYWHDADTTDGATVLLPAAGVTATDLPVYLGWCGADPEAAAGTAARGALDAAGHCDDLATPANDPTPDSVGAIWARSLTLIAGTSADPVDIYIGASQTTSGAAHLGLASFNDIVLGYWSRTPSGRLTVSASAVAIGIGDATGRTPWRPGVDTASAIRTAPADTCGALAGDDTARCGRNLASELVWTGSVAAPRLSLAANQYRRVVLVPEPTLADTAPPLFPSLEAGWRTLTQDLLAGTTVCGTPACNDF